MRVKATRDWTKVGVMVAIGLGVASMVCTTVTNAPAWVSFLEDRGYDWGWLLPCVRLVQGWWQAVFALGLLVVVGCLVWWFRSRLARGRRWLRRAAKQVWWRVLWHRLEEDLRSRLERVDQIAAEVLAAALRLGERRQDRRLFLSLRDAEALVRRRRFPPQAGIGGAAWAKKGCEELKQAGLVRAYGDARNQTWMVWLDKRVTRSRLRAQMIDVVEGMLASRGEWRW